MVIPDKNPAVLKNYWEGFRCFAQGEDLKDNPYAFRTRERVAWADGWNEARRYDSGQACEARHAS